MRQRKIKDIENKLLDYMDLIIKNPADYREHWREVFLDSEETSGDENKEGNLFVEVGCGKGKFITELANQNPSDNFVAIEGFSSVMIRATQKARNLGLKNVIFVLDFVFDFGTWFGDEEVDGIYLNFSDPWPKKKNAKRRLTYRDRLDQYYKALAPGGFLRIKTDNDDFFDFTLEEIEAHNHRKKMIGGNCGFEIVALTRDLHNSEWASLTPMTEYESKFADTGKNINFVYLVKTNE